MKIIIFERFLNYLAHSSVSDHRENIQLDQNVRLEDNQDSVQWSEPIDGPKYNEIRQVDVFQENLDHSQ